MPGEKTEQPSAKKLRDARKKGQVFKSQDFTQAMLFLTAAGVLGFAGRPFFDELRQLMIEFFQPAVLAGTMPLSGMLARLEYAFSRFFILVLPLLAALCLVAAATVFLQVNALFSPEVIMPKFEKLNPVQGFQNVFFKAKTYIELAKNLVKFAVIVAVVYYTLKAALHDVLLAERLRAEQAGALASDLMSRMLIRTGGVFLLLGAADFGLQKKQYMKEMMMSKEEKEKEYKQEEGDPHVKGHRKALHQELLNESAMHQVPKATAVVVNPTHLAVALKYDEKTMNAPSVVAKGRAELAQKILALAREHRVPVLRNVPLARRLIEVDVGKDVPEELYEAVAEVLNFVYQMQQEASGL